MGPLVKGVFMYNMIEKRKVEFKANLNVKTDKDGKIDSVLADRLVAGGLAEEVAPKRGRKPKEDK